jgi:hypothetical protein
VQFKEAVKALRGQGGGGKKATFDDFELGDEGELRALFDSIDTDGSGTLGMDEYFIWTLDMAAKQGCGLEAIFRKCARAADSRRPLQRNLRACSFRVRAALLHRHASAAPRHAEPAPPARCPPP